MIQREPTQQPQGRQSRAGSPRRTCPASGGASRRGHASDVIRPDRVTADDRRPRRGARSASRSTTRRFPQMQPATRRMHSGPARRFSQKHSILHDALTSSTRRRIAKRRFNHRPRFSERIFYELSLGKNRQHSLATIARLSLHLFGSGPEARVILMCRSHDPLGTPEGSPTPTQREYHLSW